MPLANSRMEHVHIKEVLFLLDRVHLFAIQNEGNGSLQHAIEGAINMVEGINMKHGAINMVVLEFKS